MAWDTWAYQERLIRQIEQRQAYRQEHLSRIARKQPNGSQSMVDRIAGEIAAMDALLGGALYPTAADMKTRIEQLQAKPAVVPQSVMDRDAFAVGWEGELRGRLHELPSD